MRLPPRRPAFITTLALALLAVPLIAQRYDSTSARELQRRLEKDTAQLINTLRNQRNSPSPRARSGPDPWVEQQRAFAAQREVERAERARLDAAWRRDHPNETRQQYFDRIDREAAAEAREAREQREAARRVRRQREAAEAAEAARQVAANWARVRASNNGYAAEVPPPVFSSPPEALAWYLRHESSTLNEWAGNVAARYLMEGFGAPRDLVRAARLLDPNSATAKKAGPRHPETRALFADLQLSAPAAVQAAGLTVDAPAARAELEAIAIKTPLAKWYLVRVLNESAVPADQIRALQLVTDAQGWAEGFFVQNLPLGRNGRDPLENHIRAIGLSIVEQQRAHIPALIRELPLAEFEAFDDLLPHVAEPLATEAMTLYVQAIIDRVVPLTPGRPFNHSGFDSFLEKAEAAGVDGVHGLATLRRFHLLGIEELYPYKPSWGRSRNLPRSITDLTRWAAREDVIGARARLALQGLAVEAASSQYWGPSRLEEVRLYHDAVREHERLTTLAVVPEDSPKSLNQLRAEADQAKEAARQGALRAFARQDAAAPTMTAVPGILAAMNIGQRWRDELNQLRAAATDTGIDAALFAATHDSFDLASAEAFFDTGLAPDTPEILRWRNLHQAMRRGDAFAPEALARELSTELGPVPLDRLRQLSQARLARDTAARRPRAMLAHAIRELFQLSDDANRALEQAAAAGSPLASRLLLNRRIGETIARETDRPISWGLDPTIITSHDSALAAGLNEGPAHAEWSVVRVVFSEREADHLAQIWFNYLQNWIADRDERRADAAFAGAVLPQIDAVITALAQWPGLNQDDPLRAEWATIATRDRDEAQKRVRQNDGLGALQAFLSAASRGDRGALELLARHIRNGDGRLPRSPEIADRLQAAAFQMATADAEVGDGFAADYIGDCYRDGKHGVAPDPAQAAEWLRYAAELGHPAAARTLAQGDATGIALSPAEVFRWTAVRDATEYEEFLPKPPRRSLAPGIDLTAIRPELERAATTLAGLRTKKPVEQTEAQENAESAQLDAADEQMRKDPSVGLLRLATIAAGGRRHAAHRVARILARGEYGIRPEPDLAKRFHHAALGLLERDAEYGDMNAAQRLGLYALGLGEKPDVPTGLRWLSYSAELGNSSAAELLAQLYTDGIAGLLPDARPAAHWTAFAETIESETFKPRSPLR